MILFVRPQASSTTIGLEGYCSISLEACSPCQELTPTVSRIRMKRQDQSTTSAPIRGVMPYKIQRGSTASSSPSSLTSQLPCKLPCSTFSSSTPISSPSSLQTSASTSSLLSSPT